MIELIIQNNLLQTSLCNFQLIEIEIFEDMCMIFGSKNVAAAKIGQHVQCNVNLEMSYA